jgi:hypothetical protein
MLYATPVLPKNCDRQHNICAVGLLRFQRRTFERL